MTKTILRALAGEALPTPPIWMMRQAAAWAQDLGATRIGLAVSRANTAAQAAYASLGFTAAGSYAYYGPAA